MTGVDERGFPPIEDYAFLSDCHTGALVAPDGAVEWLCLPRFDSESIFAAVLDRGGGRFRIGPRGVRVPVARRYEPGTNTLETTWATETGWVVVRDALTIGPWRERRDDPHVRPPPDEDADRTLVRVVECVQGEAEIDLFCRIAPGYATRRASWTLSADRHHVDVDGDEPALRLTSDLNLGLEQDRIEARHRLVDGESCFVALSWGQTATDPIDLAEAVARLDRTAEFWRRWLEHGHFPDHPWRVHLQRSALVLRGLIYAPTGATVAAPTTSLPETPGGERNWDYRYTWIRDATFTLWSLHVLGLDLEAADFAEFIADICLRQANLQIMYGIGGETDLTERTLDHLAGYESSRPVRVGNAAHAQRQNDVYGALLDSLYIHLKAGARPPDRMWPLVRAQVEAAAEAWREPDQGIWEARGEPKHYVSSKLMCWVALDRGARLARRRDEDEELAERWGAIADEIQAEILARGVSEHGVLRQHYDTDALDASNLLAPLIRFLPPDHEVIRNTVLAIAEDLTEHGLVLRYRVEETDDGLSGVEGAFTICSFWLVSALSEIGEPRRARDLCEKLLRLSGPLDLYAEEIEPVSGRQLGNFPQAFTHLGLINAVVHVIADEQRDPDERQTAVFSEMRRAT